MATEDELYQALGRLMRKAREEAGVTQDQLAALVGLTRTSITNIEGGRQKIQVHTLYAVAQALHLSPTALLPPPSDLGLEDDLDTELADIAQPSERDWVRRILASSRGGNSP